MIKQSCSFNTNKGWVYAIYWWNDDNGSFICECEGAGDLILEIAGTKRRLAPRQRLELSIEDFRWK